MADRSTANRTGIAFLQSLYINNDITFVIASVVHIDIVVVGFACTGTQILESRKLAVNDNLAVVKMHRTGEAAYTAGCLGHFFFIRKLNCVLANVQSIYKFGHIQFSVTAYKCRNIPILISESIISHKQQCLYRLLLVELQIICHLVDSLGSRCVHLFKWKHFNAILRSRIHACCFFHRCRKVTAVAVCDFGFSVFTKCCKLVRV